MLKLKLGVLAIAAAFGLAACNDDGDSGSTSGVTISGVLLDSAVEGVAFSASPSGRNGSTDSSGRFNCQSGDTVTFKLGAIE